MHCHLSIARFLTPVHTAHLGEQFFRCPIVPGASFPVSTTTVRDKGKTNVGEEFFNVGEEFFNVGEEFLNVEKDLTSGYPLIFRGFLGQTKPHSASSLSHAVF